MIITDVRRTKRGRIAVEADGEYLTSVSEEVWILSGLFKGCDADADALNDLLRQNRVRGSQAPCPQHALCPQLYRTPTDRTPVPEVRTGGGRGSRRTDGGAGTARRCGLCPPVCPGAFRKPPLCSAANPFGADAPGESLRSSARMRLPALSWIPCRSMPPD